MSSHNCRWKKTCQFPGCDKDVHPGSQYCSISHRDQSRPVTCQFPGCAQSVFPGSEFCSRSHRDNAPQTRDARRKWSPDPPNGQPRGMSDSTSPWDIQDDVDFPLLRSFHSSTSHKKTETISEKGDEGPWVIRKVVEVAHHTSSYLKGSFGGSDQRKFDNRARSASPRPCSSYRRSRDDRHTRPHANNGDIWFYERDQPYYEFTNFAPFEVIYDNKKYPTSEHLFQALKFEDEQDAELVRSQETPRDAFNTAQLLHEKVRQGWVDKDLSVQAMEEVLRLKFGQHDSLKKLLLKTGDAKLVENSPIDAFWGIGEDHKGENRLGEILMRLRSKLRESGDLD